MEKDEGFTPRGEEATRIDIFCQFLTPRPGAR